MLSLAVRSVAQVLSRPFRTILWKSLGITLALLAVLWIAIEWCVTYLIDLSAYAWADTALSVVTGIGAFIGLGFLIASVATVFVALYQDEIAEKVEAADYPTDPTGRTMPLIPSIILSVNFLGVVILGNIVALFLLLIPGVNVVAFFLVNGYLIGREFFEFAAMRFLAPADAKRLGKAHGEEVFVAGLIIAAVLVIPIVNLLAPIFGTVLMVHLHKCIAHAKRLHRACKASGIPLR
ncbi:sulfate transporter family protein [Breoghania sp.]|uniref:sulfate transporter family protein n=1 Tax=Breoghania sp. TaxID=2065378 RepID=UPI002614DBBD|nr:sulfate transporter family protein [Breoghania sp.]MDJ0931088.1 sulfate transporter family protein [Breoghania sp.]